MWADAQLCLKNFLYKMSVRSNVWAFTVNTRKSVNLAFLDKMVKYIKKCPGGYICREKPGSEKEHLHGLIIYNEIRHKDSVMKQFKRMMDVIPSEDYEFNKAVALKCVYNDDWRNNYLQKADDTITVYDEICEIEYQNIIEKAPDRKQIPLSEQILDVCLREELTGYKEIRLRVFRYLKENRIPPPRMDMVTSMCKTLFCYMNCDNEDLINKLPVPEGYEHEISAESLKSIKFSIYPELGMK